MADACREQIVCAAETVLKAIDDVKVERNRRDPLQDEDLDSLILFEGPEQTFFDFTGEDGYRLSLLVQATLKGTGADVARKTNNLRATITKALLADVTLGGLSRDMVMEDPGDWIGTATESDDTEGFVLQVDITYATVENDPFTFASQGA